MRLYKKLVYSIVFALIVFFSSLLFKIIPCQTSPVLPNPKYTWALCTLNPDTNMLVGVQRIYIGYTTSLTETYLFVLAIAFILAFVVISLTSKKSKE